MKQVTSEEVSEELWFSQPDHRIQVNRYPCRCPFTAGCPRSSLTSVATMSALLTQAWLSLPSPPKLTTDRVARWSLTAPDTWSLPVVTSQQAEAHAGAPGCEPPGRRLERFSSGLVCQVLQSQVLQAGGFCHTTSSGAEVQVPAGLAYSEASLRGLLMAIFNSLQGPQNAHSRKRINEK